jgi:hypothetical protein
VLNFGFRGSAESNAEYYPTFRQTLQLDLQVTYRPTLDDFKNSTRLIPERRSWTLMSMVYLDMPHILVKSGGLEPVMFSRLQGNEIKSSVTEHSGIGAAFSQGKSILRCQLSFQK